MKAHARTLKHIFQALLYQLMRSAYEVKAIDAVELSRDFASKQPASASGANSPGLDVFGIAPHQVTERTLVRNLANSLDGADLHMQSPGSYSSRLITTRPNPIPPPQPNPLSLSFLTAHRLPFSFSQTEQRWIAVICANVNG